MDSVFNKFLSKLLSQYENGHSCTIWTLFLRYRDYFGAACTISVVLALLE